MAAKKQQSTGRDSLAKVREHIADVQKRLTRADKANGRAIKALEKAFTSLGSQAGADDQALQGHVKDLTSHLNGLIAQAREDITQDLKGALDNPHIASVGDAVDQASRRLTQAEVRQAESIQKINQYIARLASTLDTRLKEEARQRETLDVRLTERIDAIANGHSEHFKDHGQRLNDIETHTANAISDIGQRIVDLNTDISARIEASEKSSNARQIESSIDTQKEVEGLQSSLHSRIESLQQEAQDNITPLERQIATLAARMDTLESGSATPIVSALTSAPPFPQAPIADAPTLAVEQDDIPEAVQIHTGDAFTPPPQPALPSAVPPPMPAGMPEPLAMPVSGSVTGPVTGSVAEPLNASGLNPLPLPDLPQNGEPVAFDPAQYAQAGHAVMPGMEANPYTAAPYAEFEQNAVNPYAAYSDQTQDTSSQFADNDYESMHEARPGHTDLETAQTTRQGLSPRTLRTAASAAALVALVTVGGLMVKNNLLASQDGTDISAKSEITPQGPASGNAPGIDVEITPATGKMTGNVQSASVTQPATLEAAITAGDPIAQFQKGLTLLDGGNTEQAVEYIRKAANSGQPAAQYYLGNLYENGQGVTADATQARKLTEMAANSGHRIAMYDLALYYIEGKGGVDVNMNIAAQWFEKAAQFGMVDAQYNLAVLYERGTGVPVDPAASYVWYAIAGQNGDQDAALRAQQLKPTLGADNLGRAEAKIAGFKPAKIDEEVNGIFTNLAWNKRPAPARDEQVAKVQQILTGLGYSAGIADGAIGPKTRQAIKDFERDNSLPETGQINDELVLRLSSISGA